MASDYYISNNNEEQCCAHDGFILDFKPKKRTIRIVLQRYGTKGIKPNGSNSWAIIGLT